MRFKLEIDCDNAAFEDLPGLEVARILRDLADRLEDGRAVVGPGEAVRLHDVNGNHVGNAAIVRRR